MESFIQTALQGGEQSAYVALVVFFTGVLTSLTPCVYPMLPITAAVVGRHSKTKIQSFSYSLLYVLGLSIVYSLLGVLAASTGQLFGTVASHPITLVFVGTFCLLMAAWMGGLITIPSFVSTKHFEFSNPLLNVFIAGCLSGLIMAPCTSPVLGMLLVYLASTGDQIWSAILMFSFSFGMSTLLVLAGTLTGFLSLLPKSGKWLNFSKWFMSSMMALAAFYIFYQVI